MIRKLFLSLMLAVIMATSACCTLASCGEGEGAADGSQVTQEEWNDAVYQICDAQAFYETKRLFLEGGMWFDAITKTLPKENMKITANSGDGTNDMEMVFITDGNSYQLEIGETYDIMLLNQDGVETGYVRSMGSEWQIDDFGKAKIAYYMQSAFGLFVDLLPFYSKAVYNKTNKSYEFSYTMKEAVDLEKEWIEKFGLDELKDMLEDELNNLTEEELNTEIKVTVQFENKKIVYCEINTLSDTLGSQGVCRIKYGGQQVVAPVLPSGEE